MLPPFPKTQLVVVEDRTLGEPGFLRLRRTVFRLRFADGSVSAPFEYDTILRTWLDAVVIAPHYLDATGARHVYLRSALRPPVRERRHETSPMVESNDLGNLWELPAGLVEEDERSPEGLLRCAARELYEEIGFRVEPSRLASLGPSAFPAPAVVGERHFFFHVEVDPASRGTPTEDGSPLERDAVVVDLRLTDALDLARRGGIEDAKTELALRRLAELDASGR